MLSRRAPHLGFLVHDVGGDLYELSELLGHFNLKRTERYADLARAHMVKTGSVSRELWSQRQPQSERGKNDVTLKKDRTSSLTAWYREVPRRIENVFYRCLELI